MPSTFQEVFARLSIVFPDGLFFSSAHLYLCVGGSEGGAVFGVRFCTLITVLPENASASSQTLSILLSIARILLVFFQHFFDLCDS